MKKIICCFLLLFFGMSSLFSQDKINSDRFKEAFTLLNDKKAEDSYKILKDLYAKVDEKDTLKNYVTWYYLSATSALEKSSGMSQKYDKELSYALEALKIIQDNKQNFDEDFASREPWMIKNIVVAYSGLNNFGKAQEYKSILYKLYAEKKLPAGIDGYFNFDFFKLGDKNIYGYEWYPELPEDRFSSSFTKIVYYVYSTNQDGSDKDQVARYHVLMYHHDPKDVKFDYILERQLETPEAIISGSYNQYRYKKEIDYLKLRNDITEIVSKDKQPGSKRVIPKRQ